jgi:ubiquitin-like protein ATG12
VFACSSRATQPASHAHAHTPVVVRFKSIGAAPVMKNNVFKVTAGNKFQAVVVFLRNQLGLKVSDPLVSAGGSPAAVSPPSSQGSNVTVNNS